MPKAAKSDGAWTIGREINSEHGRKALFMHQVSKCIFTSCPDDVINLNKARETAGLTNLTAKEKRSDRQTYVRRVIHNPEEIVSKLLVLLQTNMAMDREARMQFEKEGGSCADLSPAHERSGSS